MTAGRTHLLVQHVARALDRAGLLRSRLVLGLSGGIDSVVLLDVLAHLAQAGQIDLRAVHVNHHLLPEADEWARDCAARCDHLNVPLQVAEVDVFKGAPGGPEAMARAARYEIFRVQAGHAVVLAHHLDDQAETVLLQLTRGAGMHGLSSMPLVRTINSKTGLLLVRPMLDVARAEIAAYARDRQLRWVVDPSNANLNLDRNFLRHVVLPLLGQRFPGYAQTWSRAAANASDGAEVADALARIDAQGAWSKASLRLSRLRELVPGRARNLLRWFLAMQGLEALPRARLDDMLRQLLDARDDAHPTFHVGGLRLFRHGGALCVHSGPTLPLSDWNTVWQGEPEVPLPACLGTVQFVAVKGAGLSRARLLSERCVLRGRSGGERMCLAWNRPARRLKNLLQEAGVPAWRRGSLPLLFVADELAWVPGVGVDHHFAASEDEDGVVPKWLETSAVARG